MLTKSKMSWILLRPILWKVGEPQPKSLVVSPLCMAQVGTSSASRRWRRSSSMAPTMKLVTLIRRRFVTQFMTKSK